MPYILGESPQIPSLCLVFNAYAVNPHKESGQALYRQYIGRKGKLVLNARWVYECVKHGQLQTFKANWAGCKLDGSEKYASHLPFVRRSRLPTGSVHRRSPKRAHPRAASHVPSHLSLRRKFSMPTSHLRPLTLPTRIPIPQPRTLPHGMMRAASPLRPLTFSTSCHSRHKPPVIPILCGSPSPRHIRHSTPLPPAPPTTLTMHATVLTKTGRQPQRASIIQIRCDQSFLLIIRNPAIPDVPAQFGPYDNSDSGYLNIEDPSAAATTGSEHTNMNANVPSADAGPSQPRGRKRTRSATHSGPVDPASLVPPKGPPARSPTPPTRVLKSTYGGNLYTADDVEYLKKYIDYCQDQGLVLRCVEALRQDGMLRLTIYIQFA